VCERVGNQRSRGVVTARAQTDTVRSLRHQRRDLHQSTYPVPLKRSGLILLSALKTAAAPKAASLKVETGATPSTVGGALTSKGASGVMKAGVLKIKVGIKRPVTAELSLVETAKLHHLSQPRPKKL
jgi:hypothetical protein